MSSTSELELVRRSRAGSAAAFEVLVRRHEAPAQAVARAILGDADDAADAVQDAFVRAWSTLNRLEPGSLFAPWFRTILRNLCIDRLRSTRNRSTRYDDGAPAAVMAEASGRVERAQLAAVLRDALARLSPHHRAVLVMKEMDGLSYTEIAAALRVPAGTVASRLHHARAALKRAVLERGITPEDLTE